MPKMGKSIIPFLFVSICISSSLASQVSYSDPLIDDSIDIDNLPSELNQRGTHSVDRTPNELPTIRSKQKGGRKIGSSGRAVEGVVTPKKNGVFKDVDLISRPKSPVKYYEWSYNKRTFPPLDETPFVYCPNETFVSGISAMRYQEKKVAYGIGMLRLSCSTLLGDYVSDIYIGQGKKGNYKNFRKCHENVGVVAQSLDIDYHGDDCHPGVTDVGICGNLKPPQHPDTLEMMQCPRFSAVCGVAVRNDRLTLSKVHMLYAPCPSDFKVWGPLWSFIHVGMACCKVNNPTEECIAKPFWKHILSCRPPNITCSISLTTAFVLLNTTGSVTRDSDAYSDMFTVALEFTLEVFKASVSKQWGNTKVQDKEITSIITTVSSNATSIDIDLSECDGSLVQFSVSCGLYVANTDVYECQPRGSVNIFA